MKELFLVRFDDICPTMDREQFARARELMDRYGIKPMIGIVPHNEDPDLIRADIDNGFWEMIKTLQQSGWTIALHGYTHVYDQDNPKTLLCGRKHSEFAGNSFEKQNEKIKKGKAILEEHGIYTDVFFAPAHTYDVNTLKALSENGFKYNIDGLSTLPYKQCGITNVPCHSGGVPRKLSLINIAVNHPNEWVLPGKSSDYERLEQFCKIHEGEFISFDELFSMSIVRPALSQKIIEKFRVEKRRLVKLAVTLRNWVQRKRL